MKNEIRDMIDSATSGDVLSDEGGGFVYIMSKKSPGIKQDIAAAFESYSLLSHYLDSIPVHPVSLEKAESLQELSPGVIYDKDMGKLVALLPIGDEELNLIAYWITDSMQSDSIKKMAGVLALPFAIEEHAEVKHLIPEWFAAFYVNGSKDHCIPILALKSVLLDQQIGNDWVTVALERMTSFALPQDNAQKATQQFNRNADKRA